MGATLFTERKQLDNPISVQLFELVVLADSPEIPFPHLVSPDDGNLYTGDLFEEQNGMYIFRGRDSDWIRDETGGDWCDTKYVFSAL